MNESQRAPGFAAGSVEPGVVPRQPLRALVVSYSFPPVGGAGVARVLKLCKYLPAHGIDPTVLTVKNPSVPLLDRSLEKDVSPRMEILRARTFEPGYGLKRAAWSASALPVSDLGGRVKRLLVGAAKQALLPDPQVLWQPAAQAALLGQLAQRRGHDVIFISGPPFSQFLLAPLARLRPGTAVVLDYRDEWSTYRTTYEMMGRLGAAVGEGLERVLLRAAHAVTTATGAFRDNLLRHHPFLDPARVIAIPNGYDPDDFPHTLPAPPPDKFVLTYAGTIFKLTTARGLLGAVRRLHQAEPELARSLEVRFLGRIVDTELPAFEGTEALGVKRLGYVEHGTVLQELAASHMVLCLLADEPGAERIYPGKIFELMYLGRPTLTLAPRGELSDLVRGVRLGEVLPPGDEAAIAGFLAQKLRAFRADGSTPPTPDKADIARYDRRALAGEFAKVFRSAVAAAAR